MQTILLIPARLNSQRLAQKMLLPIGNQALIAHVVDRAIESGIENIAVATDSEFIVNAVSKKKVQCIMTDSNHQSGSDRIYDALSQIDPKAKKFNHVINLQGDIPFISSSMITYLASMIESSSTDIATLVSPITHNHKINNPNFVKAALAFDGPHKTKARAVYFSRQPIPHNATSYYEHIGIYAYKRHALEKFVKTQPSSLEKQEKLEQLRAYDLNLKIEAYVVENPPISIDTAADFEQANMYYQDNFCKA